MNEKYESPLIYYHTVKTGGTSVNRWLETIFPENERVDLTKVEDALVEKKVSELEALDAESLSKKKVVYGHKAYAAVPFFPKGTNFTIVREPLSYCLSRYVFDRRSKDANVANLSPEELGPLHPLHGDAPLDEVMDTFLDWGQVPSYNTLTYYLNLHARHIDPSIPEEAYELTEEHVPKILDTFKLVGVMEQLPLFCFVISELFKLPLRPIGFSNATNSARLYIPKHIEDEIKRRTPLDVLLYDEARARLDLVAERIFNDSAESYKRFQRYQNQCDNFVSTHLATEGQIETALRNLKDSLPMVLTQVNNISGKVLPVINQYGDEKIKGEVKELVEETRVNIKNLIGNKVIQNI